MSIDLDDRSRVTPRDRVIRRRLSLWEPEAPTHRALMELYRYWETLRDADLIPARRDFDMRRVDATAGATAGATLVDVGVADHDAFPEGCYGAQVPLQVARSPAPIRVAHPSGPFIEMVRQDYQAVRDIGIPLYHEIVAVIDDVTHSYARLILPFAADHRTVDRLVVGSVHQEFSDLIQLLH